SAVARSWRETMFRSTISSSQHFYCLLQSISKRRGQREPKCDEQDEVNRERRNRPRQYIAARQLLGRFAVEHLIHAREHPRENNYEQTDAGHRDPGVVPETRSED